MRTWKVKAATRPWAFWEFEFDGVPKTLRERAIALAEVGELADHELHEIGRARRYHDLNSRIEYVRPEVHELFRERSAPERLRCRWSRRLAASRADSDRYG